MTRRYSFAVLLASEVITAGIVIEYWSSSVNMGVWIALILASKLYDNRIASHPVPQYICGIVVWRSRILVRLLEDLLGIVLFFGGGPNHDRLGFRYWNEPGAFNPYLDTGRFLAFWTPFIKSGVSFVCSPELITAAAGEVVSPQRNIPKATKRFIYRLLAFYILGSLVVGVIVSYDDPKLMSAVKSCTSDAGASPFVIGIQNAGIKGLGHVVNAATLTSAWSAGNSWVYAGSKTLYSLACDGHAPAIFSTCDKQGDPYLAVLLTWAAGLLAFLNLSSSGANVFYWFTNIATIGGFISWILVLIASMVSA